MIDYNPSEDGVTHINIYSKGKTLLGRSLTNMSNISFTHNLYGDFASMEGFWHWYFTGCCFEDFRTVNSFEAKRLGKERKVHRKQGAFSEEDKNVILEAIRQKLKQNRWIVKLLTESYLPFTHYYFYGDGEKMKIHLLPQFDWMTEEFERIRKLCKEHYK